MARQFLPLFTPVLQRGWPRWWKAHILLLELIQKIKVIWFSHLPPADGMLLSDDASQEESKNVRHMPHLFEVVLVVGWQCPRGFVRVDHKRKLCIPKQIMIGCMEGSLPMHFLEQQNGANSNQIQSFSWSIGGETWTNEESGNAGNDYWEKNYICLGNSFDSPSGMYMHTYILYIIEALSQLCWGWKHELCLSIPIYLETNPRIGCTSLYPCYFHLRPL